MLMGMECMENLANFPWPFLSVLKRFFFFHGNILGFPHEKGHVSQKDGPHKFHSFKPQMLDRRGAKASKRSSAT